MDTDCPICLEPFSAPIFILNCGHNLCGECVENLKNQDEDDDEWPCPICRAMQDKSRDLPRNFFAEQVKFSILWQVQKKIQAMVHVKNALSGRSESQQTIEIEKEFQKIRWCF